MDHRQHVLLEEGSANPYNIRIEPAYTRCGANRKVLMERQDVVLSRIRYLRMVRELRERVAQMKLTFIQAKLSRNSGKIVLLD